MEPVKAKLLATQKSFEIAGHLSEMSCIDKVEQSLHEWHLEV